MDKHLTVANVGWGDCVSSDEAISHIDEDAVHIAVVADAVLPTHDVRLFEVTNKATYSYLDLTTKGMLSEAL